MDVRSIIVPPSRIVAILLILLMFGTPVAVLLWVTAVPGRSHEGPLPALTAEQRLLAEHLVAHVTAIGATAHNVGHPEALDRAAGYIEGQLTSFGYAVQPQRFQPELPIVRNIEVVIAPRAASAPTLVLGAHYDSAWDAPGANDNGSGTAAVIELARRLRALDRRSALRIRLVLFANEEPPFFETEGMGSVAYARRLKRSGEAVIGMISLETMGYYSDRRGSQHYPPPLSLLYPGTGNFIAFAGTTDSRDFVRRAVGTFRATTPFPSVGGTAPAFVRGIDWSDHRSFTAVGIPALMVTDTAPFRYPYYHTQSDTPDKLDYQRLARVVEGLERVVRAWEKEAR
ncbi:hypothetical protein FHS96_004193 [Sphingomonas zeicaulis]|uniref:M28 family peptidase n=1 Tax=Sphingomonas zeicaulis TaxID=1632740 RepID=UPI003D19F42A